MSKVYLEEFRRVARLAWSMWNRDPASASFGSFDRQYWGWKYKDFGDATLQYAVKLAAEYAGERGEAAALPPLLEGYVSYCARIQLRDGSFDQAYPYERTPGVVHDILSTLIYVRNHACLTSSRARSELDAVITRAAGFAIRSDERHGAIANHFAEYAYELLNYALYARDDKARTKGEEYLERTLALFEAAEGWFNEYDGPDTGYQTRTLRYLSKIASMPGKSDLWRVIGKAAEFVDHLLMPDGSLHPMLGSRSTALLYPSAFEILAARDKRHAAVAQRVRHAWQQRLVPLPSEIDFCNAIRLADDAWDAASSCDPASATERLGPPEGHIEFPKAGIIVSRTENRAVYLGWRLGGVVVAYVKRADHAWKLALEDSGYLLKSRNGNTAWLTRMPGAGALRNASAGRFEIEAQFHRSLHDELTPWRLIALRLLNLTVLRINRIGELFRKLVVARLMAGRESIPLRLTRIVTVSAGAVEIADQVTGASGVPGAALDGTLYRCRRLTGTHMASARYFQEQELEHLPVGWVEEVPWQAGSAKPRSLRVDTPVR